MNIPFIICNGFDLYHELPTRYADFHNFIIDNYGELENSFEEYFTLTSEPMNDYLWSNFECDLASFSFKAFFDNYNNSDPVSESFKRSDAFGVEDEINEAAEALIESIRDAFAEWVDSIEITESTKRNSKKLNLSIENDFINFNYTSTLEELYQNLQEQNFVYP